MSRVRESIDVAVPVHVAYERLCHFEEYPHFMAGVQQVTRISEYLSHWVMDLDGAQAEFDARITGQRTDELLAWQAVDGPRLAETVTFQPLSEDQTRIIAELELEATAFMPSAASDEDSLDRRLKADLDGFKHYVEVDLARVPGHDDLPANPALDDGGILGAMPGETETARRADTETARHADTETARHADTDADWPTATAADWHADLATDWHAGTAPGRRTDTGSGRYAGPGQAGSRQSPGSARHGRNGPAGRSGRR